MGEGEGGEEIGLNILGMDGRDPRTAHWSQETKVAF